VTHPFEKRRLRDISAYNVSTIRDSEKIQLCPEWVVQKRFLGILKRVIVTPAVDPRFLEFLHIQLSVWKIKNVLHCTFA